MIDYVIDLCVEDEDGLVIFLIECCIVVDLIENGVIVMVEGVWIVLVCCLG